MLGCTIKQTKVPSQSGWTQVLASPHNPSPSKLMSRNFITVAHFIIVKGRSGKPLNPLWRRERTRDAFLGISTSRLHPSSVFPPERTDGYPRPIVLGSVNKNWPVKWLSGWCNDEIEITSKVELRNQHVRVRGIAVSKIFEEISFLPCDDYV